MKAQMYHYAHGVSIPPLRVLLGEEAWKSGLSPGRILMLFWKPATHHSDSSSTSKHPRPESGQFGVIQPSLCSGLLNAAVTKADKISILLQTSHMHERKKKSKIISAGYISQKENDGVGNGIF